MKYQFGEKLRAIRERRGITLKYVAQQIGVTESLVSQIERNKVSPAVETLLDLAQILDVELDFLFSAYRKERVVHVVRQSERGILSNPGITYEQLSRIGGELDPHGLESYLLRLAPGMSRGDEHYGHIGQEMGLILQGKAEFRIGDRVIHLEQGDSLSFESSVPHVLKNTGVEELQAVWVITPPKNLIKEP